MGHRSKPPLGRYGILMKNGGAVESRNVSRVHCSGRAPQLGRSPSDRLRGWAALGEAGPIVRPVVGRVPASKEEVGHECGSFKGNSTWLPSVDGSNLEPGWRCWSGTAYSSSTSRNHFVFRSDKEGRFELASGKQAKNAQRDEGKYKVTQYFSNECPDEEASPGYACGTRASGDKNAEHGHACSQEQAIAMPIIPALHGIPTILSDLGKMLLHSR